MGDEKITTIPMEAKFSVTFTLTPKAVSVILANGLWAGYCAFDAVDFDDAHFAEAKKRLVESGREAEEICVEDVEAAMLFLGYPLKFHELEEPVGEAWYELTLDKLIDGIRKYADNPINGGISDVLSGDEDCQLDANDYDAILQYALFGEIKIG